MPYCFAAFSVAMADIRCTVDWLNMKDMKVIPAPIIRLQNVWRTVGSVSKL